MNNNGGGVEYPDVTPGEYEAGNTYDGLRTIVRERWISKATASASANGGDEASGSEVSRPNFVSRLVGGGIENGGASEGLISKGSSMCVGGVNGI